MCTVNDRCNESLSSHQPRIPLLSVTGVWTQDRVGPEAVIVSFALTHFSACWYAQATRNVVGVISREQFPGWEIPWGC